MVTVSDLFQLHPVARRLRLEFDRERLLSDLSKVDESWWGVHEGPYHDGAWEAVALWAPRGDRTEQRSFGGDFAATEALDRCTYMADVIAAVPGEKNRVRLMRLRPGGHIRRHSDPMHTIAESLVRLHVPVRTNDHVRFLVNDQRVVMGAGELWHVDVRFPHEVENAGATARVHLVIDALRNPALDTMLERADVVGTGSLREYFLGDLSSRTREGANDVTRTRLHE